MIVDKNIPDPGPQPIEEQLSNEAIIAKYGADLNDDELRRQVLQELVYARKLFITVNRKAKKDHEINEAWMSAYVKRYGTDEG